MWLSEPVGFSSRWGYDDEVSQQSPSLVGPRCSGSPLLRSIQFDLLVFVHPQSQMTCFPSPEYIPAPEVYEYMQRFLSQVDMT